MVQKKKHIPKNKLNLILSLNFYFASLVIELQNFLFCRLNIGDVNIPRRTKGIPDHPVPVVYPFVSRFCPWGGGVSE